MQVVIIDIDAVAIPFPVATARNVVGRDDPIGLVVENDVPRARIEAADDNDVPNVRVTAARIVVAGANALAIIIPIVVVATTVMLVPAFVLAVVVAVVVIIIVIAVLIPALVLPWSSSCALAEAAGAKANTNAASPNDASSFFMVFSPKDPNSKIRCTPSAKRRVAVGRGWVSLKTSVFGTPDLQIPAGVDSTSYGNALRLFSDHASCSRIVGPLPGVRA